MNSDSKSINFGCLDTLRGLAAVSVSIFLHYGFLKPEVLPKVDYLWWLYNRSNVAVELFYMISGLIFTLVYLDKIQGSQITAKEFFLKRFARLYPLHCITLCSVTILQIIYFVFNDSFFESVINVYAFFLNLLFLQFGPLSGYEFSFNVVSWSLSMELIGYIIFFLLASRLSSKIQYWRAASLMVVLGTFLLVNPNNFPLMVGEVGRLITPFFVGSLILPVAQFLHKTKVKNLVGVICLGIFGLIVAAFCYFGHDRILAIKDIHIYYSFTLTYSLIIFPLVLVAILLLKPLNQLFSNPVGSWLGRISYSVYLWHFSVIIAIKIFIQKIHPINTGTVKFLVLYALTILGLATLSYYFIEKPARKFINDSLWIKNLVDKIKV